ncbi:unnamed protein product [Psylliodes chrysocephalus]|uniref:Uncharacterized protein n=1 Tax=Psylliodes chrysocephalus TaxID=3402493 RepID=A0A9P0D3X5_9CUCU|nr:unnamed protein product [Psylliodes chrysocephala]
MVDNKVKELQNAVQNTVKSTSDTNTDNIKACVTNMFEHITKNDIPTGSKRSYANIATGSTFIVTTNNFDQDSNSTKSEILNKINPIKEDLKVTQVRNLGQGGIAIRCENENFKQLVHTKLDNKYSLKEVTPLNPRVRIVGLSEKFDNDIFLNYFKVQNKSVVSQMRFIINIISEK